MPGQREVLRLWPMPAQNSTASAPADSATNTSAHPSNSDADVEISMPSTVAHGLHGVFGVLRAIDSRRGRVHQMLRHKVPSASATSEPAAADRRADGKADT